MKQLTWLLIVLLLTAPVITQTDSDDIEVQAEPTKNDHLIGGYSEVDIHNFENSD